ncbi:MAG: sigma-54-dependent Fis family transcriptional regulator [Acidobacteria bacterium]|nr:sigma-54-dependent Fis family transcriptional regulator [Acidobacteriota bacterium]
MARILLIDDDPGVRSSLEQRLARAGYTVTVAESAERGLPLALDGAFDVILTDLLMPGMSGIDLLRRLRDRQLDTALIIMTGFATVDTAVEAMKLGAVDYLQKPFVRDEVLLRVRAAVERRQLHRHVELLQRQVRSSGSLAAIIGTSDAIERARSFVRRAAAASGAVLITGETGTGKELVARAIHAESRRRSGPFVPVNCAALTESLLESELFGHAKGAFTNAAASRAGLIEHASGGTLFLDEVGTMPRTVQAKLLRVFEAGEIRRVGENETRHVDVRIVAATNSDLKAAIAAGDFRQDLYYRLDVLHVHLPALRDRGNDVLELADHFLAKYGPGAGVSGLGDPARAAVASYAFPGNVRQLEHAIQRAVASARSATIELADLPDDLRDSDPGEEMVAGVEAARQRAEQDAVAAAVKRHGGNLEQAARELNVSRTTLWRLRRKHISPS